MGTAITNETLLQELSAAFGARILSSKETYGMQEIEIDRDNIIEIISGLRDHNILKFQFLTDLCGVHFPDNKGKELGIVYHLHSFENNIRLRVKSFFPIGEPNVPTLTGLFAAANWMERETYDFFGIIFEGHPDLRRILNMDDMDYFPMRKEYALEDETRTDKTDKFFGR